MNNIFITLNYIYEANYLRKCLNFQILKDLKIINN